MVATFDYDFDQRLRRFNAVRSGALARNPRNVPPAANSAGTYTLADGSTVTVSASTSAPTGTNVRFYPAPASRTLADYEAIAAVEGGYRLVAFSSAAVALAARAVSGAAWDGSNLAGSADLMNRTSVESNAPAITLQITPNGSNAYRARFLIDGQYVDLAGHAPASTSGSSTCYTLTFSSTKTRTVTAETQARSTLQRIIIVDGASGFYSINRPAQEQKPRVVVVADSFGMGPTINTGIASDQTLCMQGDGMYQQAVDWLGVEGIINAIGGTCFAGGQAGTRPYTARWQDVLDINSQQPIDAVHFHGSINASSLINASTITLAAEKAAATSALVTAATAFPSIPITLSGCPKGPSGSALETTGLLVEAAYAQAVVDARSQTGSTKISFIPWQSPNYIPYWPTGGASSLIAYDITHLQPGVGGGGEACGKRFATDWFRAVQAMQA